MSSKSVFKLKSEYQPAGDQPKAISALVDGLKEGMRDQVLLGVTGSGKSVTGDTPALIEEDGRQKRVTVGTFIDRLFEQNQPFSEFLGGTEVLDTKKKGIRVFSFSPVTGKTSWCSVTQATRHKSPERLFKIMTQCGRSVTVTGDHNFYFLRNGTITLGQTSDMKTGDYVPLPKNMPEPIESIDSVEIANTLLKGGRPYYAHVSAVNIADACLPYRQRYGIVRLGERMSLADCASHMGKAAVASLSVGSRQGERTIALRQGLTDRFLRFLGFYLAEGHAERNYVIFSSADREIVSDIRSEAAGRGLSFTHRPGTYDYQCNGSAWADVLTEWMGTHAKNKHLPSFWPSLSNMHLAQMLRAYFSADGGVDGDEVTAVTASNELASDLQYALLRFGIVARARRRMMKVPNKSYRSECWSIRISGRDNLLRFQEDIGFALSRKNERLAKIIPVTSNTNVDIMPLNGGQLRRLRVKYGLLQSDVASACGIGRPYVSMVESGVRRPSRDVACRLVDFFESRVAGDVEFEALVSEWKTLLGLFWSPIVAIEEIAGEKYVYDFAVEENETFLAGYGGLFVHNTYTMANIIEKTGKATLVIAHNKTLAAQLAAEYREFFPDAAVHYFVSYYDYYQPEAYVPVTDTYIEKEAMINEDIERLRHAATQALLTRKDVIIVASVSCIYGLGNPREYEKYIVKVTKGEEMTRALFTRKLISMYFERTTGDLTPGSFRALGSVVEIMPAGERVVYRIDLAGGKVANIEVMDHITRAITEELDETFIFPAKQYVTPQDVVEAAVADIEHELKEQLKVFEEQGKILEAERLKRRTRQDLAMIREFGFCSGIENYSRHFDRRQPGEPSYTLLDYFPHTKDGKPDFLTIIDESHVTVPQLGAMYAGDRARKLTLIEHGFRLPSAVDNRPLKFDEFREDTGETIYTSATPGDFETGKGGAPVEMIIRPTGLIDPEITLKPVIARGDYVGQVKDFIEEAVKTTTRGGRSMVTVLTKKMAEDLNNFLLEKGIKSKYIHSDVKTIDRIEILTDFRKGIFDVLVGVNLLREGLDLPEVELVGILDADKEGFLRSETSLIQTMGRAARNILGRVILYADQTTGSMERAIEVTQTRRARQIAYNMEHGITPKTVAKKIHDIIGDIQKMRDRAVSELAATELSAAGGDITKLIKQKREEMHQAADQLDFETAALLRDEIRQLELSKSGRK